MSPLTVLRRAWRRAPRRGRQAIVVALALALPGGITAGASAGMLPFGDDPTSEILDEILAAERDASLGGFLDPEHLEAVPVGASSVAEPVRAVLAGEEIIETLGENGIPSVALDAYMQAADQLSVDDPDCGIRWTLLAAIGRVESDHGRFGGAQLRDDGYGTKPIRGIPLDGRPNVALIEDTDRGRLDGDLTFDRAVGPMQFIPSTWQSVGVDADGDGSRDPNNIYDAAAGAAVYLCRGEADLRDDGARADAVRRYNNADRYVRVVLDLAEMYDSGEVDVLPSVGLPTREPTPRPRTTPAPPQTAPAPESPLGADRRPGPTPDGPGAAPSGPAAPAPGSPTTAGEPATPSPTPAPMSPEPPLPSPSPPTTTAPAPIPPPPTTVTPTPPTPPTTEPGEPGQPPTTTPDDTLPPTTPTVPIQPPPATPTAPSPSPVPGANQPPAEPPAAVGWAPAMREVVVQIIEEAPAAPPPDPPEPPTTAAPPTTMPAAQPIAPAAIAPAGTAAPEPDPPPAGT